MPSPHLHKETFQATHWWWQSPATQRGAAKQIPRCARRFRRAAAVTRARSEALDGWSLSRARARGGRPMLLGIYFIDENLFLSFLAARAVSARSKVSSRMTVCSAAQPTPSFSFVEVGKAQGRWNSKPLPADFPITGRQSLGQA